MAKTPSNNFDVARRFLDIIGSPWTFQTFKDLEDADVFPRIFHATEDNLGAVLEQLAQENQKGAGVFVTVNQTDGTGRKAANITKVRAFFADLDGAPIDNLARFNPQEHVVVESSPDRFHAYYLVADCPPDEFPPIQKRLAKLFESDPKVSDLPRVMRVPGFIHQKGDPFMTSILGTSTHRTQYTMSEFKRALDDADGGPVAKLIIQPVKAAFIPPADRNGHQQAYAEAAVQRCIEDVMGAKDGDKWDTLRKAAFRLGGIAWTGLERDGIAAALVEPIRARCKNVEHALKTARESFDAGILEPLPIPDRMQRQYTAATPMRTLGEAGTPPPKPTIKPVLELPGSLTTITECSQVVYERLAQTGQFFNRGGSMITLTKDAGGLEMSEVTPERMRSIPEPFFRPMSWRSDGQGDYVLKPTPMTREQSSAVLACDARDALPDLRGLIGCPLLLDDGRVIGPGFDQASGIYVTGGSMPAEVEIVEAVESLGGLLEDFSFLEAGDRSRTIAAMITPALGLGGHLQRRPITMLEADQSQTGKGYLASCIAALYRETPRLVTQRKGGVGSSDESLSTRLIEGRPFICFDNLKGMQDSPNLEAFLTCDDDCFPARTPHRATVNVDPNRFILFATSNKAETSVDLANRSSIIRLRKRIDHEFKKYPEGDLLDHIRANQPYFLGCIFSIVRSWIAEGRPETQETRHDFRKWARSLDRIVQNVFHAAPLMDGHNEAKSRLSDPALTFARAIAVVVEQTGHMGEGLSASTLYDLAEAHSINVPGLSQADETQGPRIVGKVLGRLLANKEAVEVDGYHIGGETRSMPRRDGKGKADMKFYTFQKLNSPPDPTDPPEQYKLLKNPPVFMNIIPSGGSVGEFCSTPDYEQARALLDRLANRGVVVRVDEFYRVVSYGLNPEENATLASLNGTIKEILLERQDADIYK